MVLEEKRVLDDKTTENVLYFKNGRNKLKCFTINEAKSFRSAFVRMRNLQTNIDGLLIEHKDWYNSSITAGYDPRLYIAVTGFDNVLYAVSFKDYKRLDRIKMEESIYRDADFIDTKVLEAEPMIDDYVYAKLDHILEFVSPSDPLSIYHVEHRSDEDQNSTSNTYGIDQNALIGLKYIIAINNLRKQGINKIVIGADEKTIDYFNILGIQMYFETSTKTSFIPRNVLSYTKDPSNFIICNHELAKRYESEGYHLINIKKKDENDSILKRRIEGRERQDFSR